MARRLLVARALFLAAAALFSFLIVGGLVNIVQPSSWTGQTLLVVAFLLVASGGLLHSVADVGDRLYFNIGRARIAVSEKFQLL